MSSAGRAASSSGCVGKPREQETGLTGYAAAIQHSSLTGSSVMEPAEHREPYESRGSRTDLGAPGGANPPGDSTNLAGGAGPTSSPLSGPKETVLDRDSLDLIQGSLRHVAIVELSPGP